MRIGTNFTRGSQGLISNPARERTCVSLPASPFRSGGKTAFTLLEVMIAMGIFFMAIFAILALVSTNLRNARLLQKPSVDASMLIAELSQTNKLVEGIETGDFGDVYPGYRWTREINQVKTNGLFQVDFVV